MSKTSKTPKASETSKKNPKTSETSKNPKTSKLAAYEAKRDFQKTAEPKGAGGVRRSKALRFVVQRHDATRLHYDLRLELDGVFKSWAVTKGPSLNPADKRLAVEVEDHPLGYGDFEGTIPKGQYGGGTVQLFDRGTWAPEQDKPPDRSLADGELKFVLHGARLNGSFVLVRMKGDKFGGKRTNWLLIKHRDEAANDGDEGGGVLAIDASVASGRSMATIAAGTGKAPKPFMLAADKAPPPDAIWNSDKGLAKVERVAAGMDVSPVGKPKTKAPSPKAKLAAPIEVERVAMPDFVEPQFCRAVVKPPRGASWLHEIKFDGYRMQIRIDDGRVVLRTRTGLDWTEKFASIAKAARGLPDAMLDGEIVALDGAGNPDFTALQAAIATQKTDSLVYFAFDLLFQDEVDLRKMPLRERKSRLETLLTPKRPGAATLRYVEHFDADGPAVFASAQELGLEGIVSKQGAAAYRSGKSESWTKAKIRAGHEVVLGGWTETGGAFRSLLGGVFRDGKGDIAEAMIVLGNAVVGRGQHGVIAVKARAMHGFRECKGVFAGLEVYLLLAHRLPVALQGQRSRLGDGAGNDHAQVKRRIPSGAGRQINVIHHRLAGRRPVRPLPQRRRRDVHADARSPQAVYLGLGVADILIAVGENDDFSPQPLRKR